jgi:hypothetical protein
MVFFNEFLHFAGAPFRMTATFYRGKGIAVAAQPPLLSPFFLGIGAVILTEGKDLVEFSELCLKTTPPILD